MDEEQVPQFTKLVDRVLSSEDESVHELWRAIAEEFDRAGPDAAIDYLAAARQQLEQRVHNLLNEFEGN